MQVKKIIDTNILSKNDENSSFDDKKLTSSFLQKDDKMTNLFKFKKNTLSKPRSKISHSIRLLFLKNRRNFALPRTISFNKDAHELVIENEDKLTILDPEENDFDFEDINTYSLASEVLSTVYTQRLSITIKQNNIFCSLMNIGSNQTLYKTSADLLGFKVTQKKMRFIFERVLEAFLNKVQPITVLPGGIIFNVIAPTTLKQRIYDFLCKNFILKDSEKQRRLRFIFPPKKSFNGCRPVKKVRSKRHNIKFVS
jgi:hypothetical protein